jgi:hypothetical protein
MIRVIQCHSCGGVMGLTSHEWRSTHDCRDRECSEDLDMGDLVLMCRPSKFEEELRGIKVTLEDPPEIEDCSSCFYDADCEYQEMDLQAECLSRRPTKVDAKYLGFFGCPDEDRRERQWMDRRLREKMVELGVLV